MPIRLLAVAAVLVGGCVVTTVPLSATRVVVRQGGVVVGKTGPLRFDVDAWGRQLRVAALRERSCTREDFTDTVTTRWLGARLEVPEVRGAGEATVVAVLSVISLPVSALSTGVELCEGDTTPTTTTATVTDVEVWSCPVPVLGLPLRLELPSGAAVNVTTGPGGAAEVTIPDSEPASGRVVIRAAGGVAEVGHYHADG